jgi:hypothetical protein
LTRSTRSTLTDLSPRRLLSQIINIIALLVAMLALLTGSGVMASNRRLNQYNGRRLNQYNGRRLNQYNGRRLNQYN